MDKFRKLLRDARRSFTTKSPWTFTRNDTEFVTNEKFMMVTYTGDANTDVDAIITKDLGQMNCDALGSLKKRSIDLQEFKRSYQYVLVMKMK